MGFRYTCDQCDKLLAEGQAHLQLTEVGVPFDPTDPKPPMLKTFCAIPCLALFVAKMADETTETNRQRS